MTGSSDPAREPRELPVEDGACAEIRGGVQGVGFRPWIAREARALGLDGCVRNRPDGVHLEVRGPREAVRRLRARLDAAVGTSGALPLRGLEIESIAWRPIAAARGTGFAIEPSDASRGARAVPLAPDLPVCPDCLDELRDPSSRRFRYPFTSCAGCGPRFTIAESLPWDRERTSMRAFPPCAACAREYADPADRRHHAETIACAECGPTLEARAPDGRVVDRGEAALARAVATLRAGGVVAVLGLGGFQLACDAASDAAVARLRTRKRRGDKPFAVMVGSASDAEKCARLDAAERRLLASASAPVVLARRRAGAPLSPGVAPGSPWVGLMLATTPLHALLLDEFGAPLVATSANRSGEPIEYRVEKAPERLGALADLLLVHDRAIVAPCDDSVARIVAGVPVVLRRARGHAPRPIRLARPVARPVLGCGGQWSNAACVADGDLAWPSAHVGDLDSPEALDRWHESVDRLLSTLGVRPEVVAHDLHPAYATTLAARAWPGGEVQGVQHHHAHLASVLAEHGATGPALGLVWDGTGYGTDGTAWGGELLLGDLAGFERLATFRPVPLAGGDVAIRQVWRIACALLDDAFDGAPPEAAWARVPGADEAAREAVRGILRHRIACPPAHGVGRWFDGLGAWLLGRAEAGFQGEVAMALEHATSDAPAEPWSFRIGTGGAPWEIDLRPAVRAAVEERLAGAPVGRLADRWHETCVAAGLEVLRRARIERGPHPVVLAGGCFQNARLTAGLLRGLGDRDPVWRARRLPPGDGGLALGQAVAAGAMMSTRG